MPQPSEPARPAFAEPPRPASGMPALAAAAGRAREQLHEEIERVRSGVEAMLAEDSGAESAQLRRELDEMREETRLYVKKRLRKSERKVERSVRVLDERTRRLERRIEEVEEERERAEWRIHTDTEAMLDGLLEEIRAIADRLDRASWPR